MTEYTEEPVTPELVARLWANMWERGVEEITRHGFTLEAALPRFLEWSHDGYARVICADGEPVTIVGLCADGELGHPFTFMQASTAFDEHYREVIRRIRKFLKKHPGELYIYSAAVHPQTEGFFRVLGFVRDDWQGMTPAGWPLYRFKRK